MCLKLSNLSLPLAVGLVAFGLSMPVQAESSYSDRIYADSFGNLVVHSRSGSKRIVVGQGALAQELADYERPHAPDLAHVDSEDAAVPYECWKPAVLLKGRSYMYGLEDGELPDLPGKWCGLPEHAAPGAAIRRVQP
jgi:hypothetical protein